MSIVIFVAVMVVSLQFLNLASTQRSTVARHASQVEDIYNFNSVSEILANAVMRTLKSYQVTAPKTMLSGIGVYQDLAEELRGKFITGDREYTLFSPEELIYSNTPSDGSVAEYIVKFLEDSSKFMQVSVDNLFVPDLNSSGNVLNFKTGDRIYFAPFTIQVDISNVSSSLTKQWEVRGAYARIEVTDTEIKLLPVFDDTVIKPMETLF